jgi:hypothetical protein
MLVMQTDLPNPHHASAGLVMAVTPCQFGNVLTNNPHVIIARPPKHPKAPGLATCAPCDRGSS